MPRKAFIHQVLRPAVLLFCLFAIFTCDRRQEEESLPVSLSKTEEIPALTTLRPSSRDHKLRIAISAVISPKETFILYKELLDYLGLKMARPIELIQRETYDEVNIMMRDNELDLAFVCSGAYVDGHDQFGMEILAAPVAYGEAVYYSYIIVPANSAVISFDGLKGKRFAFTDPMSNTGKLSPSYLLARMGETPDSYFKEYFFTYSHDRSIEMVAHNLVDGAAVDSLIWEYMNTKDPSLTSQTRIVHKSEPYGIPPAVVPADLNAAVKEKLRELFLHLHDDEEGSRILAKLHIDKFIVIDDSSYDSIREMAARVKKP